MGWAQGSLHATSILETVSCGSEENEKQSSIAKNSLCDACTNPSEEEQAVIHPHHSPTPQLPKPALSHPPTVPMTSSPKRWVIKPFSPRLEQSDLRSILSPTRQSKSPDPWSSQDSDSLRFSFESVSVTGMQPTVMVSYTSDESTPDVMVQARQVAVSEDESDSEDWRPSNPSTPETASSTGSHVGFYSFVEDPASPEAEMNEAYMLSPMRQSKLNTLKEKSAFRLQTYVEERKPGRLFEDDDEPYLVEGFSKGNEVEDNQDRIEIIRNQAPKKSPVLKEQWSALENLDLSKTPQSIVDGFSLRYTPVSSKAEEAKVDPNTIDNNQIDFNAARQQFVMMEGSRQKLFPQQLPYKPRGKTLSPNASIFPSKQSHGNNLGENQRTQLEAKIKTVTLTEDPEDGVQVGARDDVDSGDRSTGYVSDLRISNDPSVLEIESNFSTHNEGETPIEREIRINQEREENLRRSRGILRADSSEMVEIRTKPIRSYLSPQIKPPKPKDTNRVSFLIQKELEKPQQSLNRLTSLYNQEQAEVKEKRKTFEPQLDEGSITSLRTNSRETPTNDLQERTLSLENPEHENKGDLSEDSEDVLSPCCPHRHPDESTLQRNYTEGKIFEIQDGKDHIIAQPIPSKVRLYKDSIDTQSSTLGIKTEPFWMVENGTSMPEKNRLSYLNTLSQPEPTKTSRYVPTWRSHLERTSWSPQLLNAPDSIRQEIEQDLKREQELQELRESSSQSFLTNRDMDNSKKTKNLKLTSTEPTYPPTQETVFSPQTPQKDLIEVDHYSWSQDTSSVSRLPMPDKGPQMSSPRLSSRLPSVSIVTPQPWGSANPVSPIVSRVTPITPLSPQADVFSPLSQKGLTETLLKDFKDRRVKLKLEESAYAGIQPIDSINNEVVEATRVTRHKNQRTLQWEAGMYANQDA